MAATACPYETLAVTFTQEERELVAYHAEQATLPVGRSKIFEGGQDQLELRELERAENQYSGMAMEAAFSKWAEFLGTGGFAGFVARRELRNQNKFIGDNGVDCYLLDGKFAVDTKGSEPPKDWAFDEDTAMSLCLTHERDMPLEKMRDIIYVFGLTQRVFDEPCAAPYAVLLVGWLPGRELYGRTDRKSLKGWSAAGRSLRKMHTLQQYVGVAPQTQSA